MRDVRTNDEQGKIGLLSRWMLDGWVSQLLVLLVTIDNFITTPLASTPKWRQNICSIDIVLVAKVLLCHCCHKPSTTTRMPFTKITVNRKTKSSIHVINCVRFIIRFCRLSKKRKKKEQEEEKKAELLVGCQLPLWSIKFVKDSSHFFTMHQICWQSITLFYIP